MVVWSSGQGQYVQVQWALRPQGQEHLHRHLEERHLQIPRKRPAESAATSSLLRSQSARRRGTEAEEDEGDRSRERERERRRPAQEEADPPLPQGWGARYKMSLAHA